MATECELAMELHVSVDWTVYSVPWQAALLVVVVGAALDAVLLLVLLTGYLDAGTPQEDRADEKESGSNRCCPYGEPSMAASYCSRQSEHGVMVMLGPVICG